MNASHSKKAPDPNDILRKHGSDALREHHDKNGKPFQRANGDEPRRGNTAPKPEREANFRSPAPAEAPSDDALALRFAEMHLENLQFTAPWSQWSEWDDGRWRRDEKLRTMSLTRDLCREAAKEDH